jgi:benzylsuccinate CoA-transferase BbsE subunit
MMSDQALAGIRVLELSGLTGGYAAKLFADMGAEVTIVEPPGGSPLRRKPPFLDDLPGPDRGLAFAYFAANKRSVVADLETANGQTLLATLAREAQLVILADHPQAATVDLEALRRDNPALVCTRITPFGSDGPYADHIGDDLTLMAMGGLLTMAGFPGEPPVVAYGEQGLLAGDQFAAVASLAALLHAEQSGEGELIDLSCQEAIVMALENAAQTYQLEGIVRKRGGMANRAGTGIYRALDGDIYLLAGGIGDTAMWTNFARWMEAVGLPEARMFAATDWSDRAPGAEEAFARIFVPFAATKTKAELYDMAREWRVPMAPMSTPADLLHDRQLAFRGFFVRAPDGSPASSIAVPGAPYKFSETPWSLRTPAPALGTNREETAR